MSGTPRKEERLDVWLEFLRRRRAGERLSAARFLSGRTDSDDALRTSLSVAETWDDEEIDARIAQIEQRLGAEAPYRTLPLPAGEPGSDQPLFDNRYKVLAILGEGGYGKVYLVEDTLQGRERLALKVVRDQGTNQAEFEQRFRNEIRVLRALNHPMIPQIFNDGKTSGGEVYYTMSYVPGRSLAEILQDEAPLDPARVVRIVRQIIDVLEYAHAKGVVHRDLKPSNILVLDAGTQEEQVRVLDFGIAKILVREGMLQQALTMQTLSILGTPHYMSPEQVRGQTIDPSTDIYALGIIIYQMCTGKLPFHGKTVMQLLTARLESKPPTLTNEQVPAWLSKLVARLLELEKEKRPSTQQIREVFETGWVEGRNSAWRSIAVAALVLVVVSAGWALWQRSSGRSGGSRELAELEPPVDPTAARAAPASASGPDAATPAAEPRLAAAAEPEPPPSAPGEEAPPVDAPDPGGEQADTQDEFDEEAQVGAAAGPESEPGPDPEPAAPPRLQEVLLESPTEQSTREGLLQVSGQALPAAAFDLSVGFEGRDTQTIVTSDGEGRFEVFLAAPRQDGAYRLVIESEGTRFAERALRVDRSGPRLASWSAVREGPFECERGEIEIELAFDEPVTVWSVDGRPLAELETGIGLSKLPLPESDQPEPREEEIALLARDSLGNESRHVLRIPLYSRKVRDTVQADPIGDPFVLRAGVAPFPPPIRVWHERSRIRLGRSDMTEWVPAGARIVAQREDELPYQVFVVETVKETCEMVLVTASDRGGHEAQPFLIDRREVSLGRWNAWIRERGSRSAPAPPGRFIHGAESPEQSVRGVQWTDARDFARWAGKALPSQAQWNRAAGWNGARQQRFSWGEDFDLQACFVRSDLFAEILPAELALDVSPWGVHGMGTGVREWLADAGPTDFGRRARGPHSFYNLPSGRSLSDDYARIPDRYERWFSIDQERELLAADEARSELEFVGFRCVIALETP